MCLQEIPVNIKLAIPDSMVRMPFYHTICHSNGEKRWWNLKRSIMVEQPLLNYGVQNSCDFVLSKITNINSQFNIIIVTLRN